MLTAALALVVSQGAAAQAADGVSGKGAQRSYNSAGTLGKITVYTIWDNTNCTAHSHADADCSGLNGANLRRMEVGTVAQDLDYSVRVAIDIYGDGTSDYIVLSSPISLSFGTEPSNYGYYFNFPSTFRGDINRVCVQLHHKDGTPYNIGGMNPYGLSQAGSCGF
jgi:hypothetical protein